MTSQHLTWGTEAVCAVLVTPAVPSDNGRAGEVGVAHARHHGRPAGWLHVAIAVRLAVLQQPSLLLRCDVSFLAFLQQGTRRHRWAWGCAHVVGMWLCWAIAWLGRGLSWTMQWPGLAGTVSGPGLLERQRTGGAAQCALRALAVLPGPCNETRNHLSFLTQGT